MSAIFYYIYHFDYWQACLLVALVALLAVLLTFLHNRLFLKNGRLHHKLGHSCFQISLWLILFAGAAAVLWMAVFHRDWGTLRVIYLNPLRLINHYLQGDAEAFRTLFMNVGVFTPFGAFFGTLFSTFQKHDLSFWKQLLIIFIISAIFSCILELGQYITACGETDIEDLITNTLGGILGFGLYRLEAFVLTKLLKPRVNEE